MSKLIYGEQTFEVDEGSTVLDTLLEHGVEVPYSCKKGTCHSCILKCDEGEPGDKATKGLRDTLTSQGYFLSCQCVPTGDLRLAAVGGDGLYTPAELIEKAELAPNIALLRFWLDAPMEFQSGQFVNLRRPDGLVRSYSIANLPGEGQEIELHVGRVEDGRMSNWLIDELQDGDRVDVRGPGGSCFYLPGRPDSSLLLVATGTGLAPLMGIVRFALAQGHTGPIHLYHGSYTPDGLYLVDELSFMSERYENLHYHACVDQNAPEAMREGRASDLALADHPDLKGWRVFLCGHPKMVETTKKAAFMAGAAFADILSDPFEISGS